jgi:hypothetical protein
VATGHNVTTCDTCHDESFAGENTVTFHSDKTVTFVMKALSTTFVEPFFSSSLMLVLGVNFDAGFNFQSGIQRPLPRALLPLQPAFNSQRMRFLAGIKKCFAVLPLLLCCARSHLSPYATTISVTPRIPQACPRSTSSPLPSAPLCCCTAESL